MLCDDRKRKRPITPFSHNITLEKYTHQRYNTKQKPKSYKENGYGYSAGLGHREFTCENQP